MLHYTTMQLYWMNFYFQRNLITRLGDRYPPILPYSNYILKVENNININTKYFWKYIQSLRKNKSNIPLSVFLDESNANNLNDITQLFFTNFSSIYTKNNITYKVNEKYCNIG